MKVNKFKRGQIWWYENNVAVDGNIQAKTRPIVILSNDIANENSNTLIGIPCTSQVKRLDMPTHVKFTIEETENIALCECIMSINSKKLKDYVGTCDNDLFNKLEHASKIALGFEMPYNKEIITEYKVTENNIKSKDFVNFINNKELTKPKLVNKTDLKVVKRGRKVKYNLDDMKKYVDDYKNYDVKYMIKKYNEVSEKAVTNKVYRFRKIINKENNK